MKIYRDKYSTFVSNQNQTFLKCQHFHAKKRRNGKIINKFSIGTQGDKVGQAFASCYLACKYCMARIVGIYIFCFYRMLH